MVITAIEGKPVINSDVYCAYDTPTEISEAGAAMAIPWSCCSQRNSSKTHIFKDRHILSPSKSFRKSSGIQLSY